MVFYNKYIYYKCNIHSAAVAADILRKDVFGINDSPRVK